MGGEALYACRAGKVFGFSKVRKISTKKGRLVHPEGEKERPIYIF